MRTPLSTLIIAAFLVNTFGPLPTQAGEIYLPTGQAGLPKPGIRVSLSPAFNPPVLKGIKVHPDNPFRFDFILDKGDWGHVGQAAATAADPNVSPSNEALKQEANKLIK